MTSPGERGSSAGSDEQDFGMEFVDHLLAEENVDWDDLIEKNPSFRDELESLSKIAQIRWAHMSSAEDSVHGGAGGAVFDDPASAERSSGEDKRSAATEEFGRRLGNYVIRDTLGTGAFATVYRAWDETTRRELALKILESKEGFTEETRARFLREARALAKLDHQNVVRIYHVISEKDILGLCMEILSGQSLRAVVEERGPLPPDEVASIGHSICSALEAVHAAGFVHRDIKADNIMRDVNGRIVLMDFGISRPLKSAKPITAPGVIVGTPIAMAPEQHSFKTVDGRTDIYALGSLLYRLSSGRYPVEGNSMDELRRKVMAADYPRLREVRPEVPEELERIVQRSMEILPDDRYPTAGQMGLALRRFLGDSVDELSEAPAPAGFAGARRGPQAAMIVLLVAILGALLVVIAILASFRD